MRYKELISEGKTFTEKYKIDEVLIAKKLNWLIDAEVEDLRLEIHAKEDKFTLIINAGKWYNGIFQYGVIRDIEWLNGTFKGGVWYNGSWKNGIFEHGVIFNGRFYGGKMLNGVIHGGEFMDMEVAAQVKKEEPQPQGQPQTQASGQTQGQIQPQVQGQVQTTGGTQAQVTDGTQVQVTGGTQAQAPAQETKEVQQAVEALSKINYSDSLYIKETVIMSDEDNYLAIFKDIDDELCIFESKKIDGVNNKTLSYDELDSMFGSSETTSGIGDNIIIWYGPNPHGNIQRIRVSNNPRGSNCFSILLPNLKVIGVDSKIYSQKNIIDIKKFIKKNLNLIMKFTQNETDVDFVLDNIKSIK